MYVYDVVVVNKDDASVVYDGIQVTETIEQAKMLTMAEIMRESAPDNETIANYHFVAVKVGEGYSKP